MAEQRYFVTLAFWQWCYENGISAMELAKETGYSFQHVNRVRRLSASRTVSQQFVDRVNAIYYVPKDRSFFVPGDARKVRRAA